MPWWLRAAIAGARVQTSRARGPIFLLATVVTPVVYTVVFLLMARSFGRAEALAAYVVIGPALMSISYSALATGGVIIGEERGGGTLELLVAAPAPVALAILGRVGANTVLSLLAIPLTLGTAQLLGVNLVVTDAPLAGIGIIALGISTMAVTLLFTSALVFARSAGIIQNLVFFPIWILSGVAFPLAVLPEWTRPLSYLLPLTYLAEMIRSATRGADESSLALDGVALVGLTILYAVVGYWLFATAIRSIRANGKITLAQ